MSSEIDSRLVLLADEDNCLVAAQRVSAGEIVVIDGDEVALTETIGLGHKIARGALNGGTTILKYGAPIGRLNTDVAKGQHLHVHNLESAYTPTWTTDNVAGFFEGDRS